MSEVRSHHDGRAAMSGRRHDLWLHLALYGVVNAIYLVLAWPLWLYVTAIWTAGLAVHAAWVFAPGPEGRLRSRRPRRDPP